MATNPVQYRRQLLPENRPSSLLSYEENETIFNILGKKCTTLSTSVVQLLLSEPPHHSKWHFRCTGVVCFVKDNPKRSYFIRVYDFDKRQLVWEQELYNTFEYKCPRNYFHTFEAHDCMAGLNFADEKEAEKFKKAINEKLTIRQQKRQERRQQQQNPQPTQQGVALTVPASATSRSQSLTSLQQNNAKKGKKDKRKNKLSKEDIGAPTNFQHIQHIGWNPNTGFDLENVDPNLMQFFEEAGISQEQLNDNDTRNFIYDFIEKHGGIQKAIQEVKRAPPPAPSNPPIASLPPQSLHPSLPSQKPPPPPTRSPHSRPHAPPAPIGAPPPPPPPIPTSAPPPPPPPPPPPMGGPPPPPPPPLPSSAPPPPPLPSGGNLPVVPDSRTALMDAIRKGSQLKHVETDSESNKSNTSNDDPRNALMNQIRQGVGLKRAEDRPLKPAKETEASDGGLKGALMRAMQERSRAINRTDDESDGNDDSGSDSDGDEWDD